MDPIYVCGHRNPDTDSVVSAMAFAALHNALGDNAYVAAMQGAPNDETQFLLDRFGFQAPTLLTNVRTQVRDIDYRHSAQVSRSITRGQCCARMKICLRCRSRMRMARSTGC